MVFISPKIQVKQSPIHRWGVFAIDNIIEGEIIEEAAMIEIEQKWLENDNSILSDYRFNFPSGGDHKSVQICFGYGSLYNHSDEPNAYWQSVYYSPDISTFRFIATQNIKPGEEILVNYGYKIQKSLEIVDKIFFTKTVLQNPSAWEGHGEFAIKLVSELKPNVVVDLGVDFGFSTFCFGYSKIGRVYGIDWFKGDQHTGHRDTYDTVMKTYESLKIHYGLNNIEFIKGDFNDIAITWDKKIDILHIDGLHTYEAVKNDYETWIKFCSEDAVIMFHDTVSFKDSVGRFFNEIESDYKLNKLDSFGLGIVCKNEEQFLKVKTLLNNL